MRHLLDRPLVRRVVETALFAAVILLSSIAVILVAIAAPIIVAVSGFAALMSPKKNTGGWRPANA